MEIKTVGVACDHAGYPLKKYVLQYLEEKGYPYKDYGTWSDASVDYPDFGHALAEGIEMWFGGRYCHHAEQASGCPCRIGLVHRDCPPDSSAQRRQRAGDAWSLYRQQHCQANLGRVLQDHFRRRTPSEACR